MSKTSKPRPLSIPRDQFGAQFDAIFTPQKLCGLCRKPVDQCGCMPTDDGPADKPEVKTHYERRNFEGEGE